MGRWTSGTFSYHLRGGDVQCLDSAKRRWSPQVLVPLLDGPKRFAQLVVEILADEIPGSR